MIKNYIFDFGNVIVHFEPEYMTAKYVKNKEDIQLVSDVVFDLLYWDKLDEGTITDEEVIAGIRSRLPERLHSSAINVYEHWYENLPLIDDMVELIAQLKADGKKLFLLSNISIYFAENYHGNTEIKTVLDMFDGLVFSGPIGITKPNEPIFQYLLNKYNLNANECVFIDDKAENIKGAEKVGIKGILFNGNKNDLVNEMKNL